MFIFVSSIFNPVLLKYLGPYKCTLQKPPLKTTESWLTSVTVESLHFFKPGEGDGQNLWEKIFSFLYKFLDIKLGCRPTSRLVLI